MSSRSYPVCLAILAAGGIGLIAAYSATWAEVPVAQAVGASAVGEVSGRDLAPLAAASGWVALASVGGVVATRSWGRVVVGVVGVLAGAAGLLGAFDAITLSGRTGGAWLLALVSGAAVATASVAVVLRGRSWPSLGRRFDGRAPSGAVGGAGAVSAWQAQDLGRDPTDDVVE